MQVVMSTEISDHFVSKSLPQTNVFLQFDMSISSEFGFSCTEKDFEDYNYCKNLVILNLLRTGESGILNCCSDLKILDDFEKFNLIEKKEEGNEEYSLYEVDHFIKGFKDKLVKGQSIWEITV